VKRSRSVKQFTLTTARGPTAIFETGAMNTPTATNQKIAGAGSEAVILVFTYIPTPTTDDGETVDETRLCQVIDYQIEHSVHGICVLGSIGGNGSFNDEEMRSATEIAAKHAAGRISVIAGNATCRSD
jgi:hypothetical protein